jgi:WD40 repeat protein
VAIAPDGGWLVAATGGAAILWRADGTSYRILDDTHDVRCVAVAPTGGWLCAGCDDGAIRLWHVDRGPAGTLLGHRDVVEAMAIAPSSTWLASASKDRTVRLWQLADANHAQPPRPDRQQRLRPG